MIKNRIYKVVNKANGDLIASKVVMADSFWLRLRGLLGRDSITEDEGIVLYPCYSIHCIGMRFTIDALFLDKEKKVIACVENLKPKSRAIVEGAKYVVELKEGIIKKKQVKINDMLVFEEINK